METFDDFRSRKLGGDLAASTSAFESGMSYTEQSTLLSRRLNTIYGKPASDLPERFRALLTEVSGKLDRE